MITEAKCAWMRARFAVDSPTRKPVTKELKAKRLAELRRRAKAARLIQARIRRQKCQGWYDPREVYWSLSAACPEWADEMRRCERFRLKKRSRN